LDALALKSILNMETLTANERALMVQIERLDVLNARLALSADRAHARLREIERILESVRSSMAEHFGVTIDVQEERE
jgi:hypothetical protein